MECQAEEFGFVPSGHGRPFAVKSGVPLKEEQEAWSVGFLGLSAIPSPAGGKQERASLVRNAPYDKAWSGWGRGDFRYSRAGQQRALRYRRYIRQKKDCDFGT